MRYLVTYKGCSANSSHTRVFNFDGPISLGQTILMGCDDYHCVVGIKQGQRDVLLTVFGCDSDPHEVVAQAVEAGYL